MSVKWDMFGLLTAPRSEYLKASFTAEAKHWHESCQVQVALSRSLSLSLALSCTLLHSPFTACYAKIEDAFHASFHHGESLDLTCSCFNLYLQCYHVLSKYIILYLFNMQVE